VLKITMDRASDDDCEYPQDHRARMRHPGVTVADGRGKEFDEAVAGGLVLGADDRRRRFQAGTDQRRRGYDLLG
jgi:hypothetical protein